MATGRTFIRATPEMIREETDRATRLYEDGLTIRAIAGRLSRSYGTTYRRLKDAGVMLRSRGGSTRRKPVS